MHFIVKVFPEIIIKSPPVRKRFIRQLRDNIRSQVVEVSSDIRVSRDWEKVELIASDAGLSDQEVAQREARVTEILAHTPGIGSFLKVLEFPLGDMHQNFEQVLACWQGRLVGKTFCVRVKRSGRHDFTSTDVERYIGGGLAQHTENAGVVLKKPDVTVRLEIKDDRLLVVSSLRRGLGGYPLGSQESVLSLISGGFDSTVSTYLTMKRGIRTHFCFFNLGGRQHEMGVKEVSYFLWNKYGVSHPVKFITVPFEGVVSEILQNVDNSYMGVVLKRMMMRAASQVAAELKLPALVTGESVAQVSSQTLPNLNVIDRVTDTLVLRPLVTMDKGEIIDISRHIGTETFAASMPEYCGVISVRPTTRAKLDKVVAVEEKFDFAVLEQAVQNKIVSDVRDLAESVMPEQPLDIVSSLPVGGVIIDIRHPDEEALKPLAVGDAEVLKIPFYTLNNALGQLEGEKRYYLYCDKGIMSQLHASHLVEDGQSNIGVYRPE
ncbi:tRNA 4-thiouridine(8) synthase ThiI [Gilvimarinus agarilyticus]|uniref:tRNA uracil 4-sulfurtransferase ThiI n=1 Tax=Gilvimarinus sp. 2_MG-2023 TaxID=3062666 RepID=UPI001C0947FE|nr:tRNA uracil 4-sulfurtransferase ThiI [Gilvimarinus sp. 2_MG-2023]MBU2887799.1 tRNA 4-thiouridine(8) synthase ThiI [Gilvimarinus agarilyticus]MDO6572438.1 tRNA uracil 4-sulfurtransferase ThiI [Gilvimarinus sp. 2_MG-2023]